VTTIGPVIGQSQPVSIETAGPVDPFLTNVYTQNIVYISFFKLSVICIYITINIIHTYTFFENKCNMHITFILKKVSIVTTVGPSGYWSIPASQYYVWPIGSFIRLFANYDWSELRMTSFIFHYWPYMLALVRLHTYCDRSK